MKPFSLADHRGLLVKLWVIILVVDSLLIMLQLAGAVASYIKRAEEQRRAVSSQTEVILDEYEGGRAISDLPEPLRTIVLQMDLNREDNVATFFNALHFLAPGLLALLIIRFIDKKRLFLRFSWLALGLSLVFLAVDEIVSFHAIVGVNFREVGGINIGPLAWTRGTAAFLLYLLPLTAGAIWLVWTSSETFYRDKRIKLLTYAGILSWATSIFLDEVIINNIPSRFWRTEMLFEETLELAGCLMLMYGFARFILSKESTVKQEGPVA